MIFKKRKIKKLNLKKNFKKNVYNWINLKRVFQEIIKIKI